MSVTVAICTWNRSAELRKTLDRMRELEVPVAVEWELLIVNNGSTDDTDAVVESFNGLLPVRLLHEPAPGLSRARNVAIAEAKGDVLLWTDDDVVVGPRWMTALLAGLQSLAAGLVFGRSEPVWPGEPPNWYSDR